MPERAKEYEEHIVVAVPTRDRPEALRRCLDSLARLALPRDASVGVVVVDNADSPDSLERTRAIAASRGLEVPLEVLGEPTLGEAFARNRALDAGLEQKADALVFLDDDQTVPPHWLATLVEVWREERADVVEAPVRWEFEGTGELREFFVRERDVQPGPPRERRSKAASTNGVLIDRKLLEDWGLRFDTSFGLNGGVDTAFFKQAASRGITQVLTRETFTVEHCPRDKETRRWILRRAFRIGGNKHQFGQSPRERARFAVRGLVLLIVGGVKGLLLWPARVRSVRALQKAARGAGMLTGAFGFYLEEFRTTVGR